MENFDSSIEEMIKADEIRATLVPGGRKSFYLRDVPWTMIPEPWRIRWIDKRSGEECEVYPVGEPYAGKKYVMFITYDEDGVVSNYVFLQDQYHYLEEGNEAVDD